MKTRFEKEVLTNQKYQAALKQYAITSTAFFFKEVTKQLFALQNSEFAITEIEPKEKFELTSNNGSIYSVSALDCNCTTFSTKRIPCQHVFFLRQHLNMDLYSDYLLETRFSHQSSTHPFPSSSEKFKVEFISPKATPPKSNIEKRSQIRAALLPIQQELESIDDKELFAEMIDDVLDYQEEFMRKLKARSGKERLVSELHPLPTPRKHLFQAPTCKLTCATAASRGRPTSQKRRHQSNSYDDDQIAEMDARNWNYTKAAFTQQ